MRNQSVHITLWVTANIKTNALKHTPRKIVQIACVRKENFIKDTKNSVNMENLAKRYGKDNICEFKHGTIELFNKNKELKEVTTQVSEFEDLVKIFKIEVSELEKEDKEKTTIITNLLNVKANSSKVVEEKNC